MGPDDSCHRREVEKSLQQPGGGEGVGRFRLEAVEFKGNERRALLGAWVFRPTPHRLSDSLTHPGPPRRASPYIARCLQRQPGEKVRSDLRLQTTSHASPSLVSLARSPSLSTTQSPHVILNPFP